MVRLSFLALTGGVSASPFGPTKRTTSGATGSLKSRRNVGGEAATVAPSAGSDPTSEACASAALGEPKPASTMASSSTRVFIALAGA